MKQEFVIDGEVYYVIGKCKNCREWQEPENSTKSLIQKECVAVTPNIRPLTGSEFGCIHWQEK